MRFYVASSWRNLEQPELVSLLREAGHEVYDFRNPAPGDHGFHWATIDRNWRQWTPRQFRQLLNHPIAQAGFMSDYKGMEWADACLLVLPCGKSAHLEAGWFAGKGKPVAAYIQHLDDPELMYKLFGPFPILTSKDEVLEWAGSLAGTPDRQRSITTG